ncbi:ABC transporter ATP-binding protein [Sinorhizobium terangae]|uniref:ABC transporter ATP-binding protein n=1 Tax=Sinorhizobium terangae TaxID=110322 RepID=UPI0024B05EDD|nr:ABC transporter ATP-binding protein [Sinorhizobium terangae]WFU51745.1 ABC transporter ATP-binding protein [Sinorhizobium terangae]
MQEAPLLKIENLTVGLANSKGRPVIKDINLEIFPGDTIGIVGESGSGKSTLALTMLGHFKGGLKVETGKVTLAGINVLKETVARLKSIYGNVVGYVPQNAGKSLTPSKRIGRLIEEVLECNTGLPRPRRRERMLNLLRTVQLRNVEDIAQRYPYQLSGGEQQRCAIALALAGDAKLLILDEPTSALDATTHDELLSTVRRLIFEKQLAIACVTHDMGVVARLCSRVAVMYAGSIVEIGSSSEILNAPQHPYTQGLIQSIPKLAHSWLPAAIAGTPPSMGVPICGCAFAQRCPVAIPECSVNEPPILYSKASLLRCHNPQPQISPQVSMMRLHNVIQSRPGKSLLEIDKLVVRHLTAKSLFRRRAMDRAYRGSAVLRDVSLSVRAGTIVGVIGESGSGKSTLLRAIVGEGLIESGEIKYRGEALPWRNSSRSLELRRQVQLLWQNPHAALNPRQTVFEAIAAPLRLYFNMSQSQQSDRALELLELVRLGRQHLDRRPNQLSGGEAQRVAIARACAATPDLMLCDEITSALDASVQAAILTLIETISRTTGAAFLFVSHDLAVVRAIADTVIVLRNGEICETGSTEAVLTSPAHPYTRSLIDSFQADNRSPREQTLCSLQKHRRMHAYGE